MGLLGAASVSKLDFSGFAEGAGKVFKTVEEVAEVGAKVSKAFSRYARADKAFLLAWMEVESCLVDVAFGTPHCVKLRNSFAGADWQISTA